MVQDVQLANYRQARGLQPLDSLHYLGGTHVAPPVVVEVDNQDAAVRLASEM